MDDIIDRIRRFAIGSSVGKLVVVNAAVFIVVRLSLLFADSSSSHTIESWLELPASVATLISQPWTLLTYIFVHFDILHLLINILMLHWFGGIIERSCGSRHLLALYITAGLAGGIAFIAACSLQSSPQGYLIGASASITALVVAAAILHPDRKVSVPLAGIVSLKWVATAIIVIEIISALPGSANSSIAHAGGAALGVAFALFRRSRRFRLVEATADEPTSIEQILKKISTSGHASLTPSERRILFDITRTKTPHKQ